MIESFSWHFNIRYHNRDVQKRIESVVIGLADFFTSQPPVVEMFFLYIP